MATSTTKEADKWSFSPVPPPYTQEQWDQSCLIASMKIYNHLKRIFGSELDANPKLLWENYKYVLETNLLNGVLFSKANAIDSQGAAANSMKLEDYLQQREGEVQSWTIDDVRDAAEHGMTLEDYLKQLKGAEEEKPEKVLGE